MRQFANRATPFLHFVGCGRRVRCCIAVAVALLLAAATTAHADPILTFNEATGSTGNNLNHTVGWQFNVTTPVTVTGLGWFDAGGNGLAVGHTVGIWDPSGGLLASVMIPDGTGAPLDGQFRTVDVTPFDLPAGDGYIIGGQNSTSNSERLAFDVAQMVDPRINFVGPTFDTAAGLNRPTTPAPVATTGFYGPSFSVTPADATAMPEPRSVAIWTVLLIGGFAACVILKRKAAGRALN
jgi:Domain of unknown function (DUF4082)